MSEERDQSRFSLAGGGQATPKWVAKPPIQFFFIFYFFFIFIFLKKSIFISFLINLYFFIKMDTCRHKMATRVADVAF